MKYHVIQHKNKSKQIAEFHEITPKNDEVNNFQTDELCDENFDVRPKTIIIG